MPPWPSSSPLPPPFPPPAPPLPAFLQRPLITPSPKPQSPPVQPEPAHPQPSSPSFLASDLAALSTPTSPAICADLTLLYAFGAILIVVAGAFLVLLRRHALLHRQLKKTLAKLQSEMRRQQEERQDESKPLSSIFRPDIDDTLQLDPKAQVEAALRTEFHFERGVDDDCSLEVAPVMLHGILQEKRKAREQRAKASGAGATISKSEKTGPSTRVFSRGGGLARLNLSINADAEKTASRNVETIKSIQAYLTNQGVRGAQDAMADHFTKAGSIHHTAVDAAERFVHDPDQFHIMWHSARATRRYIEPQRASNSSRHTQSGSMTARAAAGQRISTAESLDSLTMTPPSRTTPPAAEAVAPSLLQPAILLAHSPKQNAPPAGGTFPEVVPPLCFNNRASRRTSIVI